VREGLFIPLLGERKGGLPLVPLLASSRGKGERRSSISDSSSLRERKKKVGSFSYQLYRGVGGRIYYCLVRSEGEGGATRLLGMSPGREMEKREVP